MMVVFGLKAVCTGHLHFHNAVDLAMPRHKTHKPDGLIIP
jgi:hypothetical protein